MLFTEFNHEKLSLNELAIQLKLRFNIDISKQGIDERFTQASVNFIKSILEKAIKIIIAEDAIEDLGHFAQFTQVKIKDSTSFQLPPDMAEKYPGSGGSASKAAIRIQFERDLGYSKFEVFEQIIQSGAYFLSRLKYNINVYEKNGNEFVLLDFGKIETYLKETNQTFIEKKVYIGNTKKIPVRLLIELFPEDKKKKRLEKAHKEAKRKGRKVGKCYKERYGLNLFITNIDEKMMEGQKLRKLYLLRWQIELMFKTWKSIGEIHHIKKMKIERFESYLYAKLLWIVINWKVFWQMQICAIKNKAVVLSAYKVFTTFKHRLYEFRQAISKGKKAMDEYIDDMMNVNVQKFKVENRKERLSLLELIETY
ncbi:MAG: transposase [Candidatus Staskawiczbacteria bacterium]|nr:transposase [Candidatus Staskawiczbacteria bacterium]